MLEKMQLYFDLFEMPHFAWPQYNNLVHPIECTHFTFHSADLNRADNLAKPKQFVQNVQITVHVFIFIGSFRIFLTHLPTNVNLSKWKKSECFLFRLLFKILFIAVLHFMSHLEESVASSIDSILRFLWHYWYNAIYKCIYSGLLLNQI